MFSALNPFRNYIVGNSLTSETSNQFMTIRIIYHTPVVGCMKIVVTIKPLYSSTSQKSIIIDGNKTLWKNNITVKGCVAKTLRTY
ncbi:MAG: hypothetical protein MJY70_03375 [Bacteroidales bacterium]|nr:hypothetical protein [Bacteroidales bacterium]